MQDLPNISGNDTQRKNAFFGDDFPRRNTLRNRTLRQIRSLRFLQAWIKPHSYGWMRFSDDIEALQKQLVYQRTIGLR